MTFRLQIIGLGEAINLLLCYILQQDTAVERNKQLEGLRLPEADRGINAA